MDQILNELSQITKVDTWVPLSKMTTLRIGGRAHFVVYPENMMEFDLIMTMIRREHIPFKIFGKGSNLLCADRDFDGIIIKLDRHFNSYYFRGSDVVAQAGCSIIELSIACMKAGLSGLEFASGIPATVGGVTYMNAGAYKSCMHDVIAGVFVYRDERFEWISGEDCGFSYRHSIFQDHPDWIILAVHFHLVPGEIEEIRSLMDSRRQRRMASQPLDKPSCGSVFHNPDNDSAWKYIDGIGYRGHQIGDAKVSEKHVNFIINDGNASAADFLKLVNEIQQKVHDKYGVDLEMEVEKFNWD